MADDFRDDIREAMGAGPAPDTIDEAILTLSAAARLQKKAAEIRQDAALMKAVRARVAELTGGRKGSRAEDEDA
jgi:hypothetical protein